MPTLSRPETAVIGAAIESVPPSMVTAPGEKPGSLLVAAGDPYSAVWRHESEREAGKDVAG